MTPFWIFVERKTDRKPAQSRLSPKEMVAVFAIVAVTFGGLWLAFWMSARNVLL